MFGRGRGAVERLGLRTAGIASVVLGGLAVVVVAASVAFACSSQAGLTAPYGASGPPGAGVLIRGSLFYQGLVTITWGEAGPRLAGPLNIEEGGQFSAKVLIPADARVGQAYDVWAHLSTPDGQPTPYAAHVAVAVTAPAPTSPVTTPVGDPGSDQPGPTEQTTIVAPNTGVGTVEATSPTAVGTVDADGQPAPAATTPAGAATIQAPRTAGLRPSGAVVGRVPASGQPEVAQGPVAGGEGEADAGAPAISPRAASDGPVLGGDVAPLPSADLFSHGGEVPRSGGSPVAPLMAMAIGLALLASGGFVIAGEARRKRVVAHSSHSEEG